MEAVLDLYAEADDPQRPRVCFDECPYQLLSEVRIAQPATPGRPARHDYEYKREGSGNLFMMVQPHAGWRHVKVTAHRGILDFAHCMKELVDVHFPTARCIRVVMDNLNTHRLSNLYEVFDPTEARRIARKIEIHYTPKHGSWLNMAEIEFAVVAKQCLDRRIPTQAEVQHAVNAWVARRNRARVPIQWGFTTDLARTRLERLYSS